MESVSGEVENEVINASAEGEKFTSKEDQNVSSENALE